MPNIRIVLVEPSHPGNIGSAARALKTMGLSELVLVRPKRFPDPQADWRAAGALDIVERIQVFDSIEDAVAQSVVVAATSARVRHIPWPSMTSTQFAQHIYNNFESDQLASIIFGREDSGLTNEELNLANLQVYIPSNPEYGSLNLAMAVQVVAYDIFLSTQQTNNCNPPEWDKPLATAEERYAFYEHLYSVLRRVGFSDPNEPREAEVRLRRMFGRIPLDHTEVQIMRGALTHIEKSIQQDQGVDTASSEVYPEVKSD